MNKRLVYILGLALLLVGISSLSLAYWDRLSDNEDHSVIVGEGATVTIESATDNTGKKLVPTGVVLGANEVYQVEFQYTVKISKAPQSALDLDVLVNNVKIDNNETNGSLVNFTIEGVAGKTNTLVEAYDLDTTIVNVTVVLTLTQPETETQYLAIAEKAITFNVSFTAVAR